MENINMIEMAEKLGFSVHPAICQKGYFIVAMTNNNKNPSFKGNKIILYNDLEIKNYYDLGYVIAVALARCILSGQNIDEYCDIIYSMKELFCEQPEIEKLAGKLIRGEFHISEEMRRKYGLGGKDNE